MMMHPLKTIKEDARRLTTHVEAYHAFSYCTLDRYKLYLRYHLCPHAIGVLCGLHAKLLCPYLALPCNSSTWISDVVAAPVIPGQYKSRRWLVFEPCAYAYGHGLFPDIGRDYPCGAVFFWHLYQLCFYHDTACVDLAIHHDALDRCVYYALCGMLYSSLSCDIPACVLLLSADKLYFVPGLLLCLALYKLFRIAYMKDISHFFADCFYQRIQGWQIASFCICYISSFLQEFSLWRGGLDMLCMFCKAHPFYYCLCRRIQELRKSNLYIYRIAFDVCLEVNYPYGEINPFIVTAPDVTSIAGPKTCLNLPLHFITNRHAEQVYMPFWHVEIHAAGDIIGQYTKIGPFNQGSSPPINKSFLDGVENALVAGGMTYWLATPYHLYVNPTLNSGVTRTDTVTGGTTGVPTGAKGVIIGVGILSNTTGGGWVNIFPAGAANPGQYASFSGPVANQYTLGTVTVPVSAGGQISVKANGQNCVLQDWYIYGYIM